MDENRRWLMQIVSTFGYTDILSITPSYFPDPDASFSNFACKGYNTDVPSMSQAVDTLKAGGTYTVQLSQPGAQHGGGSCQWSLS